MTKPKLVSREEWLLARKQLLAKEKQLTRQRDELDRERRELPWVRVDKQYGFDGPNGKETLGELFGAGRSLSSGAMRFTPEQIATGKVRYNYADRDFLSDESSGVSVFYKDDAGDVFHTYSTYGRGDELMDTTYMYLDLTPKGRNETGPHYNLMDRVRHHDRYIKDDQTDASCRCGGAGRG